MTTDKQLLQETPIAVPRMDYASKHGFRKIWRFLMMYGLVRTWFKVAGRRRGCLPVTCRARKDSDIAMVGCGQYAYATIGYFVSSAYGARFRWCYDPDDAAAEGFHRSFRVKYKASYTNQWLSDPDVRIVYVASNHHSHTDYACAALERGCAVYIEKPVSVTEAQLAQLERSRLRAEAEGKIRLFAGYNRPFSKAISDIKVASCGVLDQPISLSCFVSGHKIGADHWYRRPEEGTRICGNAGHWIDLFVHLCSRRGRSNEYRITLLPANLANADDDFALSIATGWGDIFTLMLTARTEPFEGINETINLQQGDLIAKIDDFRRMTLWHGTVRRIKHYWPKDVGHARAILQPFSKEPPRNWDEVVDSSVIMLAVTEMVRNGQTNRKLYLADERARIFGDAPRPSAL